MKSIVAFVASFCLFTLVAGQALPAPGGVPVARQMTRAELVAREKFPDLFRKRDTGSPSDVPFDPCVTDGAERRGLSDDGRVLSAEEMAAFLKNRGRLTWANGTTYYTDPAFVRNEKKKANSHPGYYHRVYNVVKDSVGNKLLEISIPHYKKWKSTLVEGGMVHLSSLTAMRAEDVDKLEQLLLDDPEFVDTQVYGFRINRRFFEAANSY